MPQHSERTASRAFIPSAVRKSHVQSSDGARTFRTCIRWWRQSNTVVQLAMHAACKCMARLVHYFSFDHSLACIL
jgi:hypothetical protein